MSSTPPERGAAGAAALRSIFSRDSLIVAAALGLAAALAWAWLLLSPMAGESMAGMNMGPNPLSSAYLVPAFVMWAIMMIAMMVPSATPMILLHARIDKAPEARVRAFHTAVFALAYLLVWTIFSAAAALCQALLVNSGIVHAASLATGSRALAAGLLLAAAAYELTAAKRVCLEKCQSPLVFMLRHFRPGTGGALRLGLVHGLFCLGCCWALMLLLFVGGVMNLAWVALLGILVLAEKFAPRAWHSERYLAGALAIGAAGLLFA